MGAGGTGEEGERRGIILDRRKWEEGVAEKEGMTGERESVGETVDGQCFWKDGSRRKGGLGRTDKR